MRDVEPAEGEHILIVGPFAFHETDIEPLFLEKPFLNRHENWRFAGQADVTDADLVRPGGRTLFTAAGEKQRSDNNKNDSFGVKHKALSLKGFEYIGNARLKQLIKIGVPRRRDTPPSVPASH